MICVKIKPVQLCLTMPLPETDSETDDIAHELSSWHTASFKDHNPPVEISAVSNILRNSSLDMTLSMTLARHFDWRHFFASLVPVRHPVPTSPKMRNRLFLGSVVTHRCGGLSPLAYIPHVSQILIQPWELRTLPGVHPSPGMQAALNRCAPPVRFA